MLRTAPTGAVLYFRVRKLKAVARLVPLLGLLGPIESIAAIRSRGRNGGEPGSGQVQESCSLYMYYGGSRYIGHSDCIDSSGKSFRHYLGLRQVDGWCIHSLTVKYNGKCSTMAITLCTAFVLVEQIDPATTTLMECVSVHKATNQRCQSRYIYNTQCCAEICSMISMVQGT